jgi:hypothetical protein
MSTGAPESRELPKSMGLRHRVEQRSTPVIMASLYHRRVLAGQAAQFGRDAAAAKELRLRDEAQADAREREAEVCVQREFVQIESIPGHMQRGPATPSEVPPK